MEIIRTEDAKRFVDVGDEETLRYDSETIT